MAPSVDLESLVKDLRDSNRALMEEMQALKSRLPPEPEPEFIAGKFYEFPRVVYKPGHKKGQIDHPGVLAMKVATKAALDKALADGWSKDLPADGFDYDKLDEPEPVKKGKK